MTPERRKQPRIRLGHLAYIHVEPDSGAIVLDVSDDGIGFHSVAPFHQMEPICIRFSLHARKQLKVCSGIAWVDETRRRGGLKFNDLSSDLRSDIRTRLLAVPLRSKKESTSALSETTQNIGETQLDSPSYSMCAPLIQPPLVGTSHGQQVTSAVAHTRKRKLSGYGRLLAGFFLGMSLSAICLFCPYRVQVSTGILFPGSANTKYLELNGFANIAGAQSAANMLMGKGLPVLLVHKDFLWMNFNSILIGPYLMETDLEQVRGTLESEGFSVESRTWSQVTRSPLLEAVKIK